MGRYSQNFFNNYEIIKDCKFAFLKLSERKIKMAPEGIPEGS